MYEKAIIVRAKTRLEQLVERFNTEANARFYLERSGTDFDTYLTEHKVFHQELSRLVKGLSGMEKVEILDRRFLPSYLFAEKDLVFILGQDGLVANTAKYALGRPLVAINPNPEVYDGILLPFDVESTIKSLGKLVHGEFDLDPITMAKAEFSDGQSLLAFNDFFIGASSHISARYKLRIGQREELQSSSGILVSTGAGSTGWMSSVFNMVNGIQNYYGVKSKPVQNSMSWNTEKLMFAVREPFKSKNSNVDLTFGEISRKNSLKVESMMPQSGRVFSDGIEADSIVFNTGTSVEISLADAQAQLVAKH